MLKRVPPLKKITDAQCMYPEHNPPGMMVYEPGEYEWTCHACGNVQRFTVTGTSC